MKKSRYVHTIRGVRHAGAYDVRRPALFKVSEAELQRLEGGAAHGLGELGAVGAEQEGALVRALNDQRQRRRSSQSGCFTDMRLSLTERCNMSCDYCFQQTLYPESQPRMSEETLRETLSWFLGQANQCAVTIQYFGGEPMLEWRHLVASHEMLEEARSQGVIEGYRESMTTNGTVMTRERARWLIDREFEVRFSFDGPPEVNDLHRVMRNGTGSSERALRGLRNWVDEGGETAILMTATPENLRSLPGHVKWFLEQDDLQLAQIGINSPQPNAEGWETGGPELAETIFEIWQECNKRGIKFHGPGTQIPQYINSGRPQQRSCADSAWMTDGPGQWPVYVAADGRRSLCLVHHNDKRIAFDAASEKTRAREWHFSHGVPLDCDSCPALTVCGGPCVLERLLWGDNLASQKCGFMRTMLDLVIRDELS